MQLRARTLALATCWLLPASAAALDVEAGVFAALPPALETGQTVGGELGAVLDVAGPLRLGARLGAGHASESNLTYALDHTELTAALTGALVLPLDRAELSLRLEAGALALLETRLRHQSGRLGDTGGQGEQTAWAAGAFGGAGVRVRLGLLSGWAVLIGAGPRLTWLGGDEDRSPQLGWSGELAASYRFGG